MACRVATSGTMGEVVLGMNQAYTSGLFDVLPIVHCPLWLQTE